MAAIKQLSLRINSTKSIEKITSSMKMVAASKLRGDERRMNECRPFFGSIVKAVMPDADFPREVSDDPEDRLPTLPNAEGERYAFVAASSDRGLCGAVNSFCVKAIVKAVEDVEAAGSASYTISTFGEKCRSQLERNPLAANNMYKTMDEIYLNPLNFTQTCALTERLLEQDYTDGVIAFNRFKSAIAYDTSLLQLPAFAPKGEEATDEDDGTPANLKDYEFEPEDRQDALANLREWATASVVYGALIENAASEQSARMSAMDNASKNAAEMIESLTLKFNRARQAAITTELIEIISGASALED